MDDSFRPNFLLDYELEYELKIRGVESQRTVADKRKILSALLNKEKESQKSQISDRIVLQLVFDDEKREIEKSIKSISDIINDFEGDSKDSTYLRMKSRLAHVSRRITRFPNADDAQEIFNKEAYATCLTLESDLYDKILKTPTNQPSTSQSNPTPIIHVAAPVVTCSGNIPAIGDWQVKFNGDGKNLYNFLERIKELAQSRKVKDEDLFNSAAELFTGDAFVWFKSIKHTVNDWTALEVQLKRDFLHSDVEDDLWEQIKNRKQKRSESVAVFISHMQILFSRLSSPPAEVTKIKHTKRNLLPEYIIPLALSDIHTLDDLITLCKKLEEANYLKNKVHAVNEGDKKVEAVSQPEHDEDCNCPECACPNAPSKMKAIASKASKATDMPEKAPHPPDCVCDECLCLEEVIQTDQVGQAETGVQPAVEQEIHALNCACPECLCPECSTKGTHAPSCKCAECICTPCDKMDKKESKPGQAGDQAEHPPECTCIKCACDICEDPLKKAAAEKPKVLTIEGQPHEDGCKCVDCICKECLMKLAPVKHDEGCQCVQCVCVECLKKLQGPASPTLTAPPATLSAAQSQSQRGPNCACEHCICIDCKGLSDQPSISIPPSAGEQTVTMAPDQMATVTPGQQGDQDNQKAKEEDESCTCAECTCVTCTKKKEAGAPAQVSPPSKESDHGEDCNCAVCQCQPPPQESGHGEDCNCANCQCKPCFKKPLPEEECTCKVCTCVTCSKKRTEGALAQDKQAAQEGQVAAQGDQETHGRNCTCTVCECLPSGKGDIQASQEAAQTGAGPMFDPPPFEPYKRIDCDCKKCDCAICSTHAAGIGRTIGSGPSQSMFPEDYVPPPFEVPVRIDCICDRCSCTFCNKTGPPQRSVGAQPSRGLTAAPVEQKGISVQPSTTIPAQGQPSTTMSAQGQPSKMSASPSSHVPGCRCAECACKPCKPNAPRPINSQPSQIAGQSTSQTASKKPSQVPSTKASKTAAKKPSQTASAKQSQAASVNQSQSADQKKSELTVTRSIHFGGVASSVVPPGQQESELVAVMVVASRQGPAGEQKKCTCDRCFCNPCKYKGFAQHPPGCTCTICCCNPCKFAVGAESFVTAKESKEVEILKPAAGPLNADSIPIHCGCPTCTCGEGIIKNTTFSKASVPTSTAPSTTAPVSATVPPETARVSDTAPPPTAAPTHLSTSGECYQSAETLILPKPDVRKMYPEKEHPEGCDCGLCRCAPCPDPKQSVKAMDNVALAKSIQAANKENCECKEQIEEIKRTLEKIKCACSEAEYRSTQSIGQTMGKDMAQPPGKPFVKQASAFGQTMSGLKMALNNLQAKCKAKDKMIEAMTTELNQRGTPEVFDRVLDVSVKIPTALDYDQAEDVKSLDRSKLTTNIIYPPTQVKDEGTAACDLRCTASKGVEVRTHKHKKKKERSSEKKLNDDDCSCSKPQIIQKEEKDCQKLDLTGFEVVDIRRITDDSLIVKWNAPNNDQIQGYDIFVNGTLASKVMSGTRTSAMMHSLDLTKSVQITIYSVTKCGRVEPPAIAIYEIKC